MYNPIQTIEKILFSDKALKVCLKSVLSMGSIPRIRAADFISVLGYIVFSQMGRTWATEEFDRKEITEGTSKNRKSSEIGVWKIKKRKLNIN